MPLEHCMTANIVTAAATITQALSTMAAQNAIAAQKAAAVAAAAQAGLANRKVARSVMARRWFGKVAEAATWADDGASLANKLLQAGKAAVVAALPVVNGPSPNDAVPGMA